MGFWDKMFARGPKPDGTIRYRDDNGDVHEKHVDPIAMRHMLKQAQAEGKATRVYRILVKNVLSPVIEECFLELTPDQVTIFVVPHTSTAYALYCFDEGEPKFVLIPKELWDGLEGYVMPKNLLL